MNAQEQIKKWLDDAMKPVHEVAQIAKDFGFETNMVQTAEKALYHPAVVGEEFDNQIKNPEYIAPFIITYVGPPSNKSGVVVNMEGEKDDALDEGSKQIQKMMKNGVKINKLEVSNISELSEIIRKSHLRYVNSYTSSGKYDYDTFKIPVLIIDSHGLAAPYQGFSLGYEKFGDAYNSSNISRFSLLSNLVENIIIPACYLGGGTVYTPENKAKDKHEEELEFLKDIARYTGANVIVCRVLTVPAFGTSKPFMYQGKGGQSDTLRGNEGLFWIRIHNDTTVEYFESLQMNSEGTIEIIKQIPNSGIISNYTEIETIYKASKK